MDQKQMDRLQTAVQWVVDEDRWAEEQRQNVGRKVERVSNLRHRQTLWAAVRSSADDEVVSAMFPASESMEDWRVMCASGCCVAGNVVSAEGDRFVLPAATITAQVQQYGSDAAERTQWSADFCIDTEGNVHTIESRAQELLGINREEARRLFAGENRAYTIVRVAEMIAHDHGFTLTVV